jgi:Spy/CpxP family protein refolding chaperone
MEMNQRKPRAIAAFLILTAVVLGALGGIAFDRLVLLPRVGYAGETPAPASASSDVREGRMMERNGAPAGRRASGERYLLHLQTELELTAEQTEQIGEILRDQQQRVMAITRETRPRMQGVAEDTRAALREVLTTEQWEEFQEMRRRRHGDRGQGTRGMNGHGGPAGEGAPTPAEGPGQSGT